jgi:hypothetical protein
MPRVNKENEAIPEGKAEHCWHNTITLTSWPQKDVQRCCWCNSERTVRWQTKGDHGPHLPMGAQVEMEPVIEGGTEPCKEYTPQQRG